MNAALLTKVRASGKPKGVFDELQHLRYWVPVALQPLHAQLIERTHQFVNERNVDARLRIEADTISSIRRFFVLHPGIDGERLLTSFVDEIERIAADSRKIRAEVLKGVVVADDYEDRLIDELQRWLKHQRLHGHEALIAWLDRLLTAWRSERTKNHSFVS